MHTKTQEHKPANEVCRSGTQRLKQEFSIVSHKNLTAVVVFLLIKKKNDQICSHSRHVI